MFAKSAKGLPRQCTKAKESTIDEQAKFFEDGFVALGKKPLATGAGERAEDGVDGGTNSEASGGDCSPDTDADVANTAAVLGHIALEGADGSDGDGDAPNKLAAPVAGLAVAPTVDTHVFIWLAHTSRSATCGGCTRRIEAWEFRMLFHPDPKTVQDRRRWATVWWKYFHSEERCVRASPSCRDMLGSVVTDAARRSTESPEGHRQLCDAAMLRLRDCVA